MNATGRNWYTMLGGWALPQTQVGDNIRYLRGGNRSKFLVTSLGRYFKKTLRKHPKMKTSLSNTERGPLAEKRKAF